MIKKVYSYFILIVVLITLYNLYDNKNMTVGNDNIKIYYSGDVSKNYIYLTFDDGYSRDNTIMILDILKEYGVKAAFFLEGSFFVDNPDVIKRAVKEGHIFGNHTWSHVDSTALSKQAFLNQLEKVEDYFYKLTGYQLYRIYRPPMGFINENNLEVIAMKNYQVVYWNVTYPDYNKTLDKGEDYAFSQIVSQTSRGAIILMHTMLKSNVNALPKIIIELKKRGFEFSSLVDLLGLI